MKLGKVILSLLLLLSFALFFIFDLKQYLSFDYLQSQRDLFREIYQDKPALVFLIYFATYVFTTAISFPGAAVLTLLGGALFGFWAGTVIVSFASTVGATLAFLMTRYLLKDWVQKRFEESLRTLNEGMRRDGDFYLFSLRLVPVFPFFLVNLLMALTPMSATRFFFVSQLGMILGTAVFVQAGTQLAELKSLSGIVSPNLALSFAALGIFPLLAKWLLGSLRQRRLYRRFSKPKKFDYNVVVIGGVPRVWFLPI